MRAVVLGAILFGALVAWGEAPACAYAREEFARLWRGVSDCPAPMLRLEADAPAARSPVLESLRSQVRDDGYALLARTNVLTIVARHPRGCLYGVYGYFQRFAGVRWYFPGKDGEVLLHRPDFSLGEFSVVENPSFAGRSFNLVSAYCMPETILGLQFENLVLNNYRDLLPRLHFDRVLIHSAAPYHKTGPRGEKGAGLQVDLLLQSKMSYYAVEIKRWRTQIGQKVVDEMQEKCRRLKRPSGVSLRTALVYAGELARSVEADGYFDALVPASDLLGL